MRNAGFVLDTAISTTNIDIDEVPKYLIKPGMIELFATRGHTGNGVKYVLDSFLFLHEHRVCRYEIIQCKGIGKLRIESLFKT